MVLKGVSVQASVRSIEFNYVSLGKSLHLYRSIRDREVHSNNGNTVATQFQRQTKECGPNVTRSFKVFDVDNPKFGKISLLGCGTKAFCSKENITTCKCL